MSIELDIPWLREAGRRRRWLVGISGGADSVALVHLLVEAGFRDLVVCHVDHRLRGRASAWDARFVGRLAGRLGLPCEVARVDVSARAREFGESVEAAARRVRHEWFAACGRKYRCRRVVLAHHADDQAETVLWNWVRGSYGLRGMRAEGRVEVDGMEMAVFRPLLGVRRADLRAWLVARGHPWREDASNAEPVAVRNRLRHEVLPLLAEVAGRDVVPLMVRGLSADQELREVAAWALARAQVLDPQGRLHVPVLRGLPEGLQRLALADYLKGAGVSGVDRALLERALQLVGAGGPARVNLPGGKWLRRREGRIFVEDF